MVSVFDILFRCCRGDRASWLSFRLIDIATILILIYSSPSPDVCCWPAHFEELLWGFIWVVTLSMTSALRAVTYSWARCHVSPLRRYTGFRQIFNMIYLIHKQYSRYISISSILCIGRDSLPSWQSVYLPQYLKSPCRPSILSTFIRIVRGLHTLNSPYISLLIHIGCFVTLRLFSGVNDVCIPLAGG